MALPWPQGSEIRCRSRRISLPGCMTRAHPAVSVQRGGNRIILKTWIVFLDSASEGLWRWGIRRRSARLPVVRGIERASRPTWVKPSASSALGSRSVDRKARSGAGIPYAHADPHRARSRRRHRSVHLADGSTTYYGARTATDKSGLTRAFLGPLWDHTVCAIVNDLRVYARLAAPKTAA
jgi:hypothetical protein